MIFCEECGTKLPEGTTKCPNCGAVVNAVNTETNNIDISKDSSKAVEQAQQNSAPQNEASQAANEQNAQQYQQQTYAQQPYAQPMYQNYQQPQQPYNYAPNLAYNMPQMHGLVLAEGEVFVRQYQCSYIQSFFHWISVLNCKGYLTITNQRVIFQGKGPTSRINSEVSIDSIGGFDSYCGRNISIWGILIGLLVTLAGFSNFTVTTVSWFGRYSSHSEINLMGLLVMVIGILIILGSIQKSFLFKIFSSRGTGATITLGVGPLTSFGNGALKTLKSAPTQDTDRMINELGAVIHDLQTMGDAAIEKWSK